MRTPEGSFGEKNMDPRALEPLLQFILPIALTLVALNVGANMIGFGKKWIKKLTTKVVQGLVAVSIFWLAILILAEAVRR
jgi:hypothetical protein